eukprot:TRINITY_DN3432_c0_g1_i4.p1 TRINITY_DN3432_c0_g1~~TRINITY_DN3432_c0_g1_i4.p1  ORF type:complete len:484 (-),score=70.94 TRINITY_DN3432_c0_g1_i4:475-1926(-)
MATSPFNSPLSNRTSLSDYSCDSEEDVVEVCFIRHGVGVQPCQFPDSEETDEHTDCNHHSTAELFADWHADSRQHDPSLSQLGFQQCTSGAACPPSCGLAGLKGGLQSLAADFQPDLVVCSPLSVCIQSALAAFDNVPILVHPSLSTLRKKGLTESGQFPAGAPKYRGSTRSELMDSVLRASAAEVDFEHLPEEWYDPEADFKQRKAELKQLVPWLSQRPERKIAVVTHGPVIKRILGCKVGHGQYVRSRCFRNGAFFFTQPLFREELPSYIETDNESELSETPTKSVLFIRHCQDEATSKPGGMLRLMAERYANWHTCEWREQSMQLYRSCRDPCLTDLGIAAASTGVEPQALRVQMNAKGYGGIPGGLTPLVKAFEPQLIVCSPLSRCLQTCLVLAADLPEDVEFCVHPAIQELKADCTHGGKYPLGKPGCIGLHREQLREACMRCCSDLVPDLSLMGGGAWFDPTKSYEHREQELEQFVQ